MSTTNRKGSHALILGGGIAGLTAGLTLHRHFEEVTIIERDQYTTAPSVRPHTSQGLHVHILLAKGLNILSEVLPELSQWLDNEGLFEGDLTRDVRMRYGDKWLPKTTSGISIRPCTRPILEHLLLRAVRECRNIRVRDATKAIGFDSSVRRLVVTSADRKEEILDSDWTVDSTGRGSHVQEWLSGLGFPAAEEEIVDAGVTYSSCRLQPTLSNTPEWTVIGSSTRFPDLPEATAVMRVEQGQWLAAAIGYNRIPPPKTTEDLIQRISRRLPAETANQLQSARPMTDLRHFTKTANRRRRFENVQRWPERFVSIGDAVATLNPRYGQGMTVAVLGASLLDKNISAHWARRKSLDGLSIDFQRNLGKILATPWRMALLEDRLWAALREQRKLSILERASSVLSRQALDTAFSDIPTYIRFMEIAHLLQPPTILLNPRTISKFLFPRLRRI